MQTTTSIGRNDHCGLVLKVISNLVALKADRSKAITHPSDWGIWEKPKERIRIDRALKKSEADRRNEESKGLHFDLYLSEAVCYLVVRREMHVCSLCLEFISAGK